uniref:HAD family hydrolase n=1 Tax=Candidatus Methanomethylicus mesodigestus TaxID=1867258 RepID=A0A7C3EWF3_9CREN
MRQDKRIKLISFDVDGTLVTSSFADLIWLEVMPQLASERLGIPLEDAKSILLADYKSIGPNRLEWYDIYYWIKKYHLDVNPKNLLREYKEAVTFFPEVLDVLDDLKDNFDLIVISNSSRLFLEITTDALKGYFRHAFSTVSDFNMMKSVDSYKLACEKIGALPQEVAHVGDSHELDYVRARRAGMRSYLVERSGYRKGRFIVKDLKEFRAKILGKA